MDRPSPDSPRWDPHFYRNFSDFQHTQRWHPACYSFTAMEIPETSVGNPSFLGLMGAATTDRGAQMVEDLLQLGIAISSEGELAPVLERIVTQARRFTGA